MALRQHRETIDRARRTRDDRRSERRAARDRQARDDRVREPAAGDDARDLTLAAAKQLDLDPAALYPTLVDRSRGFVYVARKADPRKAKNLEALDFAGLGFYPEELRYYPQGPVAAQVLGYAGLDNKGLEGLERSLEGTLAGQAREPDDREGPVRPRARRRRDQARDAGEERPAHDRPADPGERGGGAPGDRAPLGRAGGDSGRDGSAHRGGARDGDGATLQRQPFPDDACRPPPQPCGHRHVRAGLDVQARDGRRLRCRTRS